MISTKNETNCIKQDMYPCLWMLLVGQNLKISNMYLSTTNGSPKEYTSNFNWCHYACPSKCVNIWFYSTIQYLLPFYFTYHFWGSHNPGYFYTEYFIRCHNMIFYIYIPLLFFEELSIDFQNQHRILRKEDTYNTSLSKNRMKTKTLIKILIFEFASLVARG